MTLRKIAPLFALTTTLAVSLASASEIDVQLTTTLPQARAVKIDAVPTTKGPTSSLAVLKPTDVKASGAESEQGVLSSFANAVDGLFRYFVKVVLIDSAGQAMSDDDDSDSTPIVDIFIDTDCEDCGDYDFVVPTPPGGQPTNITGQIELLNNGGDVRWHMKTSGNNPDRPAAYAQLELLDSDNPKAPLVLSPSVTIPLDRLSYEFSDDLIFKDGEPANLSYQVYATWLDGKGAKIGQTEVFTATAETSKKRKDGTYVYRPWRFNSDLSVVVGESWDLEAVTDTYLDAGMFQYSLTSSNGGPALEPVVRTIKSVSAYTQKGQARDVTVGASLAAGQTWTFQARLLDAYGKQLGATSYVSGEVVMDDGEGLVVAGNNPCSAQPINCIPTIRVRYADSGAEASPNAVWVTSSKFAASALATTLELTLVKEKSTGPMLTQNPKVPGYLLLPVDTSRVQFNSDFNLVFKSGLPDGQTYDYTLKTAWYDRNGMLLAEGETGNLQLKKKGGGWKWTELSPIATVKIKN